MNRSHLIAAALLLAGAPSLHAQTDLVSLSPNGTYANGRTLSPKVSVGGRYAVFTSEADNFLPGVNLGRKVFFRDLATGLLEHISVRYNDGGVSNLDSMAVDVSADGRYVLFNSNSTNLVAGDSNNRSDVFLRDRQLGVTRRLSLTGSGAQLSEACYGHDLSGDGRFVTMLTRERLLSDDNNSELDLYRLDLQTGELRIVSTTASSPAAMGAGSYPSSISDDGRFVVFISITGLIPSDLNSVLDVYLKDMLTGAVQLVSSDSSGNSASVSHFYTMALSGDGSTVAMGTYSNHLVTGDLLFSYDFFTKDIATGAVEQINVSPSGVPANLTTGATSTHVSAPSLSRDGRLVFFNSPATNLVPGAISNVERGYMRDRQIGITTVVTVASSGAWALGGPSSHLSVSSDGRVVVFESEATNLSNLPGTFSDPQIFFTDRLYGSGLGAPFCAAVPNSTGRAGHLLASGSGAAGDSIVLLANTLPPGALGLFLVSPDRGPGVFPPNSVGNLCLTGSIGRFVGPGQVQNVDLAGLMWLDVDLSALPQPTGAVTAVAGETWNFQAWFRDSSASGQATSNFTYGLGIVVQ